MESLNSVNLVCFFNIKITGSDMVIFNCILIIKKKEKRKRKEKLGIQNSDWQIESNPHVRHPRTFTSHLLPLWLLTNFFSFSFFFFYFFSNFFII